MRQSGLSGACLALCLLLAAQSSPATEPGPPLTFQVPAGRLASALDSYARQSGEQLIYRAADIQALKTDGISGAYTPDQALSLLLRGTGLRAQRDISGAVALTPEPKRAASPQVSKRADSHPSANDTESRPADLGRVLVTAQKRVERIQDVPMSVSVFSGEALGALKIDGGSELIRGAPGTTFSKTNFTTHNFQIRGVGSQALSASVDSGVAINFNGMPLARNRFYEQEYFDVDRVELLRGPQGTLHSRNATAGVIDMIPRLPGDSFESELGIETGSYDLRRISGMVNVPLADELSLRLAGVHTSRDGTDYNTVTRRYVNDRGLWSGRASLRWTPSDQFEANLVWEHFREDDRRARTGKQLCRRDEGPEKIGNTPFGYYSKGYRRVFNQGCLPVALSDKRAFEVPYGDSLSAFSPFREFGRFTLGVFVGTDGSILGHADTINKEDPFAGVKQSEDLRQIATEYDPRFRAKNDIVQFGFTADLSDDLTLSWQTGWTKDLYWSSQDYTRFPSSPIFGNTDGAVTIEYYFNGRKIPVYPILPGGVFTDPQLGPSKGLRSVDVSRSRSQQWWHEFRLQSSPEDAFSFQVGANYLHSRIDDNYFVFNNLYTLYALLIPNRPETDLMNFTGFVDCPQGLSNEPNASGFHCVYIDPNPIERLDEQGHNYFRSRSLTRAQSLAGFGEATWKIGNTLRLTAGVRYTRDIKSGTPVPSQLLLSPGRETAGVVYYGYPKQSVIRQQWEEGTGRLVLDWKPHLEFTDETLIYASYARGYKAGGLNSPGIGADRRYLGIPIRDPRYAPEFVNALELGVKNTILGGRLRLNASAFAYNYRDYQVSKYIDRTVFTENFDAKIWGVELVAQWQPSSEWKFDAGLSYLRSRVGDGQGSIDVMNRAYGHPDWVLVKAWHQLASNCIAPAHLMEKLIRWTDANPLTLAPYSYYSFCTKNFLDGRDPPVGAGIVYDPATYPDVGQHKGEGFATPLGGKELPNAPRFTFNIGAQYTFPVGQGWDLTVRGDYYRQSASWARIYNAVNDRLPGWDNANLSLTLTQPRRNLAVELYVKNLFDNAPITGTFINGDDSGLTTNVFTLDPRIVGLSIRKRFF